MAGVSQRLHLQWNWTLNSVPIWNSLHTKNTYKVLIHNTLRPKQNGRSSAGDSFKLISIYENCCILVQIVLIFVFSDSINNKPTLGRIMAFHRAGDIPSPESMLTSFVDAYCPHSACVEESMTYQVLLPSLKQIDGAWSKLYKIISLQIVSDEVAVDCRICVDELWASYEV